MASDEINERNKKPLGSIYGGNSAFNAMQQQIDTSLQEIETAFVAKVTSCDSSGVGGSKTVNAVPMVQMVDANGNAYQSPAYVKLPHYRVQQGIAALIIDPVPDDLGVFVSCKRDISNINSSSTNPAPPASMRSFNGADSVMIGTIHTKEPTVYIQITQDNKILIHAPSGVTIETDSKVTINASAGVEITAPTTKINGNLEVTGTIKSNGQITGAGINFNSHKHTGVQSGSSNTGGPIGG